MLLNFGACYILYEEIAEYYYNIIVTLHYTNLRLDSYNYYNNSYQVHSHIMHFEWSSEFCDPTEADLDDGIDVKLDDSTFTDPGIIVMYDA